MILMLPVCEMRMFSILRSRGCERRREEKKRRTSVGDVVLVTVVDGTGDLPGKLSGDALPEAAVADDVVEHLAAVDILKDHVVVVLVDDHLPHAADVGVVEEHGEGGLSERADLLGGVLCGLLCGGV